MKRLVPVFAACLMLSAGGTLRARANDTMAELRTGGLVFVRTDAVTMESEDLFVSPTAVRVAYMFRNRSDAPVESIVAFPMPDIEANPYGDRAIPVPQSANFLGFTVSVGGKRIAPALEQRAVAIGVDVTDELTGAGVPVSSLDPASEKAIAALPRAKRDDWIARGILYVDTYDIGAGMKDHYVPFWTLKSTYWWRMEFPVGVPVRVEHRYRPSVGGAVAVTFLEDGVAKGERREEYRRRYCMDAAFERAVTNSAKSNPSGARYQERWISYVLQTGANWATNIERFKLTVDKSDTRNLVSFCGEGVRKTGPTTFEMTAENFYPERDLDILLLIPTGQN